MEDIYKLKHLIQKGNLMCNLDLKGAYFSVPSDQNLRKFLRFLWKGTLYEFRTWSSTSDVYKVIENSNLTPEKNQHQNDDMFERYIDFESHNTRSLHE